MSEEGVKVQTIKCLNSTINVNPIDITRYLPQDCIASAAEKGAAGPDRANTQNGNEFGHRIDINKKLINICRNANAND